MVCSKQMGSLCCTHTPLREPEQEPCLVPLQSIVSKPAHVLPAKRLTRLLSCVTAVCVRHEHNRARFRLVVPFNGTDGSGLARCYAHIALRDSQRNASLPAARWQEPGGYNSTCGPPDSTYIPPLPEQVCTINITRTQSIRRAGGQAGRQPVMMTFIQHPILHASTCTRSCACACCTASL